MSNTPNRMQKYWKEIQPFLRREWPRLTDVDIEEIEGEYDRLIHKINQIYGGGSEIQMEASIKGKLQRFLNDLEKNISY